MTTFRLLIWLSLLASVASCSDDAPSRTLPIGGSGGAGGVGGAAGAVGSGGTSGAGGLGGGGGTGASGGDAGSGAREWGTPQRIDVNESLSHGWGYLLPRLSVEPEGNAAAVWVVSQAAESQFRASYYTAGEGWGVETVLGTVDRYEAAPSVVVAAGGRALVAWQQREEASPSIWTNQYDSETGWGPAQLAAPDGYARFSVTSGPDGSMALAFGCTMPATGTVCSRQLIGGGAWTPAQFLQPNGALYAQQVSQAFDADGNMVAVWREYAETQYDVWSAHYARDLGWGPPAPVSEQVDDEHAPFVVSTGSSRAVAIWLLEADVGRYGSVWASNFNPDDGWSVPVSIQPPNVWSVHWPDLAADGRGNAVATWKQADETDDAVWTNRYSSEDGWGGPERLGPAEPLRTPASVTSNQDGTSMVAWLHNDEIWSRRYDPGTGWEAPQLVSPAPAATFSAHDPVIALDRDGHAICVWAERDRANGDAQSIWANRFE